MLVSSGRDRTVDAQFQLRHVGSWGIFNVSYGLEIGSRLHFEDGDNRLAFTMATRGRGKLVQGRDEFDFSPQKAVVFASTSPKEIYHSSDVQLSNLVLERRKIAGHCARLLGRDAVGDVEFEMDFDLTDMNGQSWLRLFHYASSELSAPHSLIRDIPAARQQMEQMLITGLLLSHRHNYTDALLRPQPAVAPFYVKRAEAFIEAHFAASLSLADIAAHAGVSARSLQSGFQNFRGMTPMAFLRTIRLQHTHAQLRLADPTATTVTEIALACGFTHMGEFSALYKKTFGVTPRETLVGMVSQ
nr:AraC family transcriptional regulator [Microvirga puerhi]